jgi:hypothetical protein
MQRPRPARSEALLWCWRWLRSSQACLPACTWAAGVTSAAQNGGAHHRAARRGETHLGSRFAGVTRILLHRKAPNEAGVLLGAFTSDGSTCSCIFRIEVSIHVPATANTVAPSPTGRCALGRERQLSRPRWCRVAVAELSARGRSRVIRRRGHLQWPHRFGLTAETTHRASRSSPTSRVDGDPSRQTPATLPQRRFESDAEGTCGGSPRPYVPTGVPPFEQTYAGSPNWPTGPGQSIHHQTRPTISHACMPHHPSPTNGCMSPRVQHVEPAIRSRHGPRLAMLFGGGCSHVRGGH